MKDFHKAVVTGAILGAVLFAAWDAHAASASANHGHHGVCNNGAMGAAAGAFGGSVGACAGASMGGAGGGNGGSYGDWYLRQSAVDAYQPWPQAEMKQ